METSAKQPPETEAGSSTRPIQPRSAGGRQSLLGPEAPGTPALGAPTHKGMSAKNVQEDVKSGTRSPQPVPGRAVGKFCSVLEGAVSFIPCPHWVRGVCQGRGFRSCPRRRERPAPSGVVRRHPLSPWGSWSRSGQGVCKASVGGSSP